MPEMIALADRIVVMSDFRVVGTMDNDHDATRMGEAIMAAIHRVDEAA
jgi:ribose transport system ATP-binding protein